MKPTLSGPYIMKRISLQLRLPLLTWTDLWILKLRMFLKRQQLFVWLNSLRLKRGRSTTNAARKVETKSKTITSLHQTLTPLPGDRRTMRRTWSWSTWRGEISSWGQSRGGCWRRNKESRRSTLGSLQPAGSNWKTEFLGFGCGWLQFSFWNKSCLILRTHSDIKYFQKNQPSDNEERTDNESPFERVHQLHRLRERKLWE